MNNINEILNIDSGAATKSFKKGDILQHEGDVNMNGYFVKSGLLRSYTIDEKGKEHIFMFAPEGWIIADIESQEFHHPTELSIECIEDSEVVVLRRDAFNRQELTPDQVQENFHLLMRRIAVLQRRILMMMSAPAAERYQQFIATYPELPNRVPQRMIASYLGITPEALSKIRGQIARGEQ